MRSSKIAFALIILLTIVYCAPHLSNIKRDERLIKWNWDVCISAINTKNITQLSEYWYKDLKQDIIKDTVHAAPTFGWEQVKSWEPVLNQITRLNFSTQSMKILVSPREKKADLTAIVKLHAKLPTEVFNGELLIRAYLIKKENKWLFVHINQSRFPVKTREKVREE